MYLCCLPMPLLAFARVKHASLSSFFLPSLDHAVVPGSPIPSLQYQEPRNSDLFFAIPITTCIGLMPSVAPSSRLWSPSFVPCLVALPQAQDSHEVGSEGDAISEEVVEQGVRLGVLLVFPSQLLTSYLLHRNDG